MNRTLPAQAGSLLAAFLLTLAASCLAAAAFTANAVGASPRADRDRDPRSAGKRSSRRSCLARVRQRQGVGRRAAVRICKRRASRAPGAETPAPPTVAAVSTPAAAAGAPAAAATAPVASAAAAGCAAAETIPTSASTEGVRAAVLCLVNAQRAANGVGALTDNAALTVAAQAHSDDMVSARYFSHTSLDGRSFAGRITAAGYSGAATAENIAWGSGGQSTPAQIVSGWMNSPGHRANILNASLSTSGVGVARGTPAGGSGATYTHDFGG
jgi:uncharacterized protein YkwD